MITLKMSGRLKSYSKWQLTFWIKNIHVFRFINIYSNLSELQHLAVFLSISAFYFETEWRPTKLSFQSFVSLRQVLFSLDKRQAQHCILYHQSFKIRRHNLLSMLAKLENKIILIWVFRDSKPTKLKITPDLGLK